MLVIVLAVGRRVATRIRRPPPEHWPQGTDNLGTSPLPTLKDVKR